MEKIKYHKILANYFAGKSLYLDEPTQQKPNIRKLVEQPWQQIMGELWDEVTETLCNLRFIECKCSAAMTDDLLVDYHEVVTRHLGDAITVVSAFRKFTQDNAYQLRSNSTLCLQLAMLEPADSPVCKEARRIVTVLAITCFEPIYLNSSDNVSHEIKFTEHKRPVQALSFDIPRGHLISSDGEELIRWDIGSSAIVSKFMLPNERGVNTDNSYAGSGRCKIAIAEQSGSIVVGSVLIDTTSGHKIRRFINSRVTEGEWTAAPAISSDSSMFAVCTKKKSVPGMAGSDHTVTVVSSASGKVIAELPHPGMVEFVVFSPDLHLLVTLQRRPGFDQGDKAIGKAMMRVWEIKISREVYRYEYDFDTASFSSDSTMLFAQSEHNIYGWSTSDWSQLFSINDVTETKYGVSFLDPSSLITWGAYSITLWNFKTSKIIGRLIFAHESHGIFTLRPSSDNKRFAFGIGLGRIELWSVEALRKSRSQGELQNIQDSLTREKCLAFSPNGKLVAICSWRNIVRIVDVESNLEIVSRRLVNDLNGQKDMAEECFFTPDGKSLVLILISERPDMNSEKTLFGYKNVSFGSVRRVSAADLTDQAVFEYGSQQFPYKSCITPDGTCVMLHADKLLQLCTDNLALIKDLDAGTRQWVFSPSGSQIAWGTREGLTVCNFMNNSTVLLPLDGPVSQPVFSPDGILIIASAFCKRQHRSEILKVFSIPQKEEIINILQELQAAWYERQCSNYWRFSNDGRRLLLIGNETIVILNLRNGQGCILEMNGQKYSQPKSVQFSPDDRFILGIGAGYVRIWNSDAGILLAALPISDTDAYDWNPNCTLLAIAQSGKFDLFRLLNMVQYPPIVTAMQIFDFETNSVRSEFTAFCIHCGTRFRVPDIILETIAHISSSAGLELNDSPCLKLPEEAWAEPNLISGCPLCKKPLQYNPFKVDNSEGL